MMVLASMKKLFSVKGNENPMKNLTDISEGLFRHVQDFKIRYQCLSKSCIVVYPENSSFMRVLLTGPSHRKFVELKIK